MFILFAIWCALLGKHYIVYTIWYMQHNIRYMVYAILYIIWYMQYGMRYKVYGITVYGIRHMVNTVSE